MTNERILEEAVATAMSRGWEFDNLDKWEWNAIRKTDTVMSNWYYFLIVYRGREKFIDAERIIYDHGFAKALWGSELYPASGIVAGLSRMPRWQVKLQQMVIADDPIAYLGENI